MVGGFLIDMVDVLNCGFGDFFILIRMLGNYFCEFLIEFLGFGCLKCKV